MAASTQGREVASHAGDRISVAVNVSVHGCFISIPMRTDQERIPSCNTRNDSFPRRNQRLHRRDALSIHAELVDTAHESQIWGAHFDGDAGDIFRIQAEIGRTSNEQTESKLNDEGREVRP